ncbi:MAG: hypothetical protein U1F26_17825 [Lysobacterales bacterium]
MSARKSLDDAETLHACLQAVSDLLTPDGQLGATERSNIALLLDLLLRQQRDAIDSARAQMCRCVTEVAQ